MCIQNNRRVNFEMDTKMNRFNPKRIWRSYLPTAIVASTVALSGCSGTFTRPPTPTPIPTLLPPTLGAQQSTFLVERRDITASVSYSGKVALTVEEDIFFRRSGRVTKVHIADGELVEMGTLIAELNTEVLEIDLLLADTALAIAQLRLDEAEESLELDRRNTLIDLEIAQIRLEAAKESLGNDEGTTNSQIEILERTLEKAEIAVAQTRVEVDPALHLQLNRSQLNLDRARLNLLDARATAPFSGEVRFITLRDDEGTQVGVGAYEPVARLVDPSSLSIELNLTREQMNDLQEGMPVTVRGLSRDGQVNLNGIINVLPRPFGQGTGPLTTVELEIPPSEAGLVEGSNVDVEIQLATKENALVVPLETLFGFSGQYYVRVQNGTQQQTIDVEIGIQNATHAEIINGLTDGQELVGRN